MKNFELKNFSNHVAILQLEDLHNTSRIVTYAKSLPQESIVLLGEYIVDPFFSSQWENNPEILLKDKNKIALLTQLAKDYNHTIVAPVVQYKNKGYYKTMTIVSNDKTISYTQQRLIQYEHWNEAKFFSNDTSKLPQLPFTFIADGIKFGVLFGFEAHFDEFWMEFKRANVDVVLVSTVSTFDSHARWKNLLTTHSFTNSCYVFRANRIGHHKALDGTEWNFYGHSFVSLGQNTIDELEGDEEMLCVEIDRGSLENLKNEWKFR